jgi:hypothetical protein
MSATWTWPVHRSAAGLANPFFAATNVTVWSARTVGPSGSPVSQSRPDGMSTASTFAPLALMAAITWSNGGRTAPVRPVPNRASTTHSAAASSRRSAAASTDGPPRTSIGTPERRRMPWLSAASPVNSSGLANSRTRTGTPRLSRLRAMTKPSPPLFPLPQQTMTGPQAPSARSTSAAPRPAFSMSTAPGTPNSLMARRSMARTSSRDRNMTDTSRNDCPSRARSAAG